MKVSCPLCANLLRLVRGKLPVHASQPGAFAEVRCPASGQVYVEAQRAATELL